MIARARPAASPGATRSAFSPFPDDLPQRGKVTRHHWQSQIHGLEQRPHQIPHTSRDDEQIGGHVELVRVGLVVIVALRERTAGSKIGTCDSTRRNQGLRPGKYGPAEDPP